MQALWMLLAALLFASMSVCIKLASAHFNTMEMVCYRGLIGVAIMAVWCRAQGVPLTTRVPLMHVWRSCVGVTSLATWFYAIAHLPLALAMTLNYMSAVWVAAFLVLRTLASGARRDIVRPAPALLAGLVGFAGVVMILRPTVERDQLQAGLVGLVSGLSAALAYLQVAALGRAGEPEVRTVFYFSIGAALTGAVGMLASGASPWVWPEALWLLPIGVLAALGQFCMTRAYRHGATLVVTNLQYSGIVFAALYSVWLFGDQLPLLGWAGMALIIGSGITATALRGRTAPPR